MQNITADAYIDPFPHLIFHNFYDDEELKLIWEELDFYTKPNKLLDAKGFGAATNIEGEYITNSKAIHLDSVYKGNYRNISNILNVSRKIFDSKVTDSLSELHDCCLLASRSNFDVTKVRYYHNLDYYKPHTDTFFHFLAFSYFHREPKRFKGGNLFFPKYDYEFACDNNSLIMMPSWVEHGVSEVSIKDSDYYDGYGRYAITHFFGCKQS
tara:strand:- start:474 stop:1106 length:633 start_codon:yes stop_codon:yes gene_type:complete